MSKMKSAEECISGIEQRGNFFIKWVSAFIGVKSIARVRCHNGHEWETTADNLIRAGGCRRCASDARIIPPNEIVRRINGTRFKFIGWCDESKTMKSRVTVECKEGHRWDVSAGQIIEGSGCPRCNILNKTRPEKDVIDALNKGPVTFVSWHGEYVGVASKATMKCEFGHTWVATAGNVLNGKGCGECATKKRSEGQRKPQKQREKELSSTGYEFVGWVGGYRNNISLARMRCQEGHEWEARVNSLLSGSGCSVCHSGGYNPKIEGSLYLLRSEDGTMCKIGISNRHTSRLDELRKRTPFKWNCVEVLHSRYGGLIAQLERMILSETDRVAHLEKFDGHTEWRVWDPRVIDWFKEWGETLKRCEN